jgi:hypothetical protein
MKDWTEMKLIDECAQSQAFAPRGFDIRLRTMMRDPLHRYESSLDA